MNAVLRDLGDRSKQFKQFNPMRGLNFDLWLLHPMLRACLLSLSKDLKSNDAKDRLAAGLRERLNNSLIFLMKEKADYSQERSKRQGDKTFCSSSSELVQLVDTYQEVKYESRTSVKWNAFLLQFVMLKHNSPGEFDTVFPETVMELNDILVRK